jgi:hypothetical protein
MRVLLAGCLFVLTACATPYQEMGLTGGVTSVRITGDTAQIIASGNAYTDADTIQRYALRKAAEETSRDGFDLFRIDATSDRSRTGSAAFGSASGTHYGVFASAFSVPIVKPGQSMMIKMLHGPAPDPLPDGEYDAHELLSYLASADHKNCTQDGGKVVCK